VYGTIKQDAGIQVYLKQISAAPLLTAEEERELGDAIKRAHALADTSPTSIAELTEREECEQLANQARERLVRSNLRLVVTIAKKYGRRGMPLADVIEEGNLGLIRAVESYDPAQNTRFSTYASWWIKQAIKRSLINSRQSVHIPAYMVELIARWKQAKAQFMENEGREPGIEELAQHMQLPVQKAQMIRRAVKATNSSKQSSSEETDLTLSEMLTDDRTPSPDEAMFSEVEAATLQNLLDQIDEREATILKLRYGLEDGEQMTLKDIGVKVGLTRERVRQIENEAIRKLGEMLDR
jgi:RNA polymerase primary sigma factor